MDEVKGAEAYGVPPERVEKNIDPAIIDVLLESDAEYTLENSKWLMDSSDAKQIANFIVNIEVPLRDKENEIKLSNDEKYWYFSEYIGNSKYTEYSGNWYAYRCDRLLEDLSEIQEFFNYLNSSNNMNLKKLKISVAWETSCAK